MTEHATKRRLASVPPHVPFLLSAFAIGACDSLVGDSAAESTRDAGATAAPSPQGGGSGAGGGAGAGSGVTTPPSGSGQAAGGSSQPLPACGQATKRAQTTLQTYCVGCHGPDSAAKGGFKTVNDVDALIASGKVVPKDPANSPIYKRLSGGTMPPQDVAKRPAAADIQAVSDWITCGAPGWDDPGASALAFVSIDSRLRTVLDDVRSISSDAERQRTRYLDLSTLANAGFSADQMQVYREAVAFVVNSLSRGRTVVAPEPIDKDGLLFRLDLRDYQWTAETWRQLEQIYPYAVIYDEDSNLFPFDETSADQIRRETATQIPVIQADWFLSHASRPPLYHSMLNLPDTLAGLEQQLGVDIQDNIRNEEVIRSGFKTSGPSQNHRVLERHELNGNRGGFWLSYDFANNLGTRNIFANPLTFTPDGGEIIFNLDNGLQAYLLVDSTGRRLDKAPNNVVQDPLSRDGTVENGISCMTCHQENGQLPKSDEIRDFVLSTGANAREIEQVLALYPENAEVTGAFEADANIYRTARAALKVTQVGNTTLHDMDDTHLGILDLNTVAAVIGVESQQLERALDSSPQAFPPEVVALRTRGGGIQRDAFESVVADVIEGLGLGRQLRVSARGSRSSSSSSSTSSSSATGTRANTDAGVSRR